MRRVKEDPKKKGAVKITRVSSKRASAVLDAFIKSGVPQMIVNRDAKFEREHPDAWEEPLGKAIAGRELAIRRTISVHRSADDIVLLRRG